MRLMPIALLLATLAARPAEGSNSRPDVVGSKVGTVAVSLGAAWADQTSNEFLDATTAVALADGLAFSQLTIVNTHAIVEHDCHIGAFVHLSPGACVAGGCRIGDGVWIGSNATVIPELVIAEGTVIGAGSTVVRPITEAGIYAGTPARRIR